MTKMSLRKVKHALKGTQKPGSEPRKPSVHSNFLRRENECGDGQVQRGHTKEREKEGERGLHEA